MKKIIWFCALCMTQGVQSQGYQTRCQPDGLGAVVCESHEKGGPIFDPNSIFKGSQYQTPPVNFVLPPVDWSSPPVFSTPDGTSNNGQPIQQTPNLHQICLRSGFRGFDYRTQRCMR